MTRRKHDRDILEVHLRRLDAEAWTTLVADLWAARGYEVSREGAVLTVRRNGRRQVVVAVADGTAPVTDGRPVDVVVARRAGGPAASLATRTDARLFDAADVGEMLLYAVDRETGRVLCERHLGAPAASLSLPLAQRLRGRAEAARRLLAPGPALVVVLVLATAAALAGAGGATGLARDAGLVAPTATPEPSPTATAAGDRQQFPPGVETAGVTDIGALADAHRRALDGSYTVQVSVARPRGGEPGATRVRRSVTAAVDGDRYRMDWYLDTPEGEKLVRQAYGDGTRRYVVETVNGTTVYRPARYGSERAGPTPDPLALRYVLVRRYLSTPESSVLGAARTGDRPGLLLAGRGQPAAPELAGTSNYSVRAAVDDRGLVRRLVGRYTVTTEAGSYDVTLVVTYGEIDATSVDAPDWYEQRFAGNGSDD